MSTNLALDQVTENQANKEVTINTLSGQIDAALTAITSLSVSAGNITVSDTNYRRNAVLLITGASVAGRTVTVPTIKRSISIMSDAANTQNIKVVHGTTEYSIIPGKVATFYNDGTANSLIFLSGETTLTGGKPFDIGTFCAGKPSNSEKLLRYAFTRNVSFLASLAGSVVKAQTAATSQADFDIQKNGSSIGTVRFAAAGTTASYVSISATSFFSGDILGIVAPATADTTLADISFTFAGERG